MNGVQRHMISIHTHNWHKQAVDFVCICIVTLHVHIGLLVTVVNAISVLSGQCTTDLRSQRLSWIPPWPGPHKRWVVTFVLCRIGTTRRTSRVDEQISPLSTLDLGTLARGKGERHRKTEARGGEQEGAR